MALVHPEVEVVIDSDIYASDYKDSLDAIDHDGTVPIPDGPGLGVEYNWDFIEANQTGTVHVYD